MPGKGIAAGIVFIVVIIALGAVLLTGQKTQSTTTGGAGTSYASVLLTDPPQVPAGTSALVAGYSSIAVHSPSSGWISSNESGSVDLLTLTNTTQVLANLNLSTNTTIDMVRFAVSNATITVNGTTYNVTVPSGQITASLTPSKVNGTTTVLVQLSPTIVTILTNTTPVFVLVPSVRAAAIGNSSLKTPPSVGAKAKLQSREKAELEAVAPNMTITNASLVQANGTVHMSVTVKDNSNASVTLQHIAVRGKENISVNMSMVDNVTNAIINKTDSYLTRIRNATLCMNATARGSVDGGDPPQVAGDGRDSSGNVSIGANATANVTVNTSEGSKGQGEVNVTRNATRNETKNATGGESSGFCRSANSDVYANASEAEHSSEAIGKISGSDSIDTFVRASIANGTVNSTTFRSALVQKVRESLAARLNESEGFQADNKALLFMISANGTMQLPLTEDQFRGPIGFNLSAGQSETFTYTGPIDLANGRLSISLIPGSNYTVFVQGERDAKATANVTAS